MKWFKKKKEKDSYKDMLIKSLIDVVGREVYTYKQKKTYLPKDVFAYTDIYEFFRDCEKQQLYAEFYELLMYILRNLEDIYYTVETKFGITKKYYM